MLIQLMQSKFALPIEVELTWSDLVETFTTVELTEKPKDTLPGWVPVKLKEGATRRLGKNVESVSALVFDFDEVCIDQWALTLDRCEGLSYCYHSSYRHAAVSGKLRYRLIVQLSRPVPMADWARFYAVASGLFAVGNSPTNGKPQPDSQCKDPNRFYFAAFAPLDGTVDAGQGEGVPLAVDGVLLEAPPRGAKLDTVKSHNALTHRDIAGAVPTRTRDISNPFIKAGYDGLIAVLNGQPFATTGERDRTLLAMSAILAQRFPDRTPEAIVAPIAAALDIGETEPGWPAQALIEKIHRDQEAIQEVETEKAQAPLQQLGISEGYTAEQVAGYAAALKVSVEELSHQLIINHGSDYWVFWAGDWLFLGSKERAETALIARLAATTAHMPVTLGEETPKGYTEKSVKRLFRDYGRHVTKVIKSLELQQSYLDGDTFYYAVCPRDPSLVPVYHDGVHTWLQSWGHPEVLDWCATAARLEKPTAALILDGAKRTGKTQLARAIARIWNERYTPLRDLGASFNDSISRCPVLYAEESVPWEFRRDTGLLKDLVTADSQQLRQKYQDTATLVGAIRLIIARNDHKLFEAGEVLSQGTVDALCDRLLYVDTGTARAPYFQSEVIASHILWLEQNHKIAPSSRDGMWVTGRPSRLHHRMRAYTTKVSASVCYWLLEFVERPAFCGDTGGKYHKLDSQGLQVAPKLVYDKWDTYCAKEARQPTLAQVADALGGIGARRGNLIHIDLDVLCEYADSVGSEYRDRSALQSRIERCNAELAKAAN